MFICHGVPHTAPRPPLKLPVVPRPRCVLSVQFRSWPPARLRWRFGKKPEARELPSDGGGGHYEASIERPPARMFHKIGTAKK